MISLVAMRGPLVLNDIVANNVDIHRAFHEDQLPLVATGHLLLWLFDEALRNVGCMGRVKDPSFVYKTDSCFSATQAWAQQFISNLCSPYLPHLGLGLVTPATLGSSTCSLLPVVRSRNTVLPYPKTTPNVD